MTFINDKGKQQILTFRRLENANVCVLVEKWLKQLIGYQNSGQLICYWLISLLTNYCSFISNMAITAFCFQMESMMTSVHTFGLLMLLSTRGQQSTENELNPAGQQRTHCLLFYLIYNLKTDFLSVLTGIGFTSVHSQTVNSAPRWRCICLWIIYMRQWNDHRKS